MSLRRSLPILLLAALTGAAAAGVAAVLRVSDDDPQGPADGEPSSGSEPDSGDDRDADDPPGSAHDAPADAARPRPPRAGRDAPAYAGPRVQLPPGTAARLSDADPDVRHREALALLRLGAPALDAIHRLRPTTQEGVDLTSRLERAIDTLRLIARGEDWGALPKHVQDEERLRWWATVVPAAMLADDRRAFLAERVAANPDRVAAGGVAAEEAMLDEMELARLRHAAGEIGEDEMRGVLASRERAVRAWISKVRESKARRGPDPDALAARLRSALGD